jgi:hypothetical protein
MYEKKIAIDRIYNQIIDNRMLTMSPPIFQPSQECTDKNEAIKAEFKPKRFWGKLFCTHFWVFMGGFPEDVWEYATGKFLRHTCKRCGKKRKFSNLPVNPLN